MKVLIIFCLVLSIVGVYSDNNAHAQPDDEIEKDKINAVNEECTSEHGVRLKTVLQEMETNADFEPTRAMLCFAACLLKKNGLMNPDGSLTRKYNDSAGAQECKNLTGRDECGAAFKIINCLNKHNFLIIGED